MRARTGYAEIIACTLTWGSIGVVSKQLDVGAPAVTFFRMLFGGTIVVAWLAVRGRLGDLRPGRRALLLAASGAILGTHWTLQFEAYQRLDVAPTILIIFLGPVLLAIAAPPVLGERLRPVSVAALALAFAGIAMIAVPDIGALDGVGLAAALGSAVLFAALLLAGKVLTRHYEPGTIVVWQLVVGSLVVAPGLAGESGGAIARALPGMIALGAGYTGLFGILFFRALRALEAQRLGVLFYLEPASAVVYAWVLLGERPGALTLGGGGLIVLAGLAIILSDRATAAPVGMPEVVAAEGEAT